MNSAYYNDSDPAKAHMMIARADSVRVAHPLFQAEGGGSTPTSALQLRFSQTDRNTFARLNMAWHSRLPKIGASQFRVCYVAEFMGLFYATAAWSNPVARLLPQQTWLELRRMAISDDAPKNTASRMIAWMVRDIRVLFPQVIRLISYQDCDAHAGTIYKASGWKPAENYISRRRGWAAGGGGATYRVGRANQSVAPRMRWEKALMTLDIACHRIANTPEQARPKQAELYPVAEDSPD